MKRAVTYSSVGVLIIGSALLFVANNGRTHSKAVNRAPAQEAAAVIATSSCPDRPNVPAGDWQVQQLATNHGTECLVRVSPRDGGDYNRSYSFSTSGSFFAFNNFKGTTISNSTSARVYRFFPRLQSVSFDIQTDGKIAVRMANGQIIRLDPSLSKSAGIIEGMTGGEISEAREVNKTNHGGVEIKSVTKGIVLDAGEWIGGDPMRSFDGRTATFLDSTGNRCTVKYSDVYTRDYKAAQLVFKFGTDLEMADFLKENCKNIDTSCLTPTAAAIPAVTVPAAESDSSLQDLQKMLNGVATPDSIPRDTTTIPRDTVPLDTVPRVIIPRDTVPGDTTAGTAK